ncbi:sulfate adenylyltransferase [bacterium]|nr:sulfate adenylyltransferase [bacterium]
MNKSLKEIDQYKSLQLNEEQIKDVKNIARGVYAPLRGFLKEKDFLRVVSDMRLEDGSVWSIPIVLDLDKKEYEAVKREKDLLLVDSQNLPIAFLKDIEIFEYDKNFLAKNVFSTTDRNHPGVAEVYQMGDYLVGGEIELLDDSKDPFPDYNFSPAETKKYFQEKNWRTVCAFQTRNVPHCGHEFLQKEALKIVDGLFIQPVIGKKKVNDFKDEYILSSFEVLIERYYPKNKVLLGILPLKMRYAGPREALFHALIRRNFGCTHFIVGRDHAGVGNYYSPYDAQEIFKNFSKREIGIEILKFPEVVYCKKCRRHTFIDSCSHSEEIIRFSGTKVREKIKNKEMPPSYIMRPEVYHLLSHGLNSLVDDLYRRENKNPGFCLWFTGLSQAGKTTIADKVYEILNKKGLKVERLDGDVVRQTLTKDLGFTKEDRKENLRRVGSLARLFVQRGVCVVASFISPYREAREELRRRIPNFVEIFVNCPLEICEKRDTKGLYRKAREGKIKNFTGISDPFEPPENPEIELRTDRESIEDCVSKIIRYLEKKELI